MDIHQNRLNFIHSSVYFCLWSFSFYPQGWLNYKTKSVAGFSIEYALLNVFGFYFYSLYCIGGYVYPHLGTGKVEPNDLVVTIHSFCLATTHLTQALIYERGEQKTFALWAVVLLIVECSTLATVFIFEGIVDFKCVPTTFNCFRVLGYNKALITFLKYTPQVYLNFKRKSTAGWSIINIMLDFSGGVLSLCQQLIDMIYNGLNGRGWSFFDSGGDAFNSIKFALSIIAIFVSTNL